MKKFLILSDGYHSPTVISDTNDRYSLNDFMKMLCDPHEEKYIVREIDMESAWEEDPAVPEEAYKFARLMDMGNSVSEYEFNTVFYFAEEV